MKNSLFWSEWKQIFSTKKILIPVIAVILVPILYAGMFLWAFWDPYARLQDVPVAVVNQDKGAEYNGESMELGEKLVDKLKENQKFQFHFVSKKDGYDDLENRKYYMLIEIPENFSENATTLLSDNPEKLKLKFVPNESYNFLASQIGESAVKEIKNAVSKEVTATYAELMFDKVKEMANGFTQASDGAGSLGDGTLKLLAGSEKLKDNLQLLASKSIEFQEGVSKAQSGSDGVAAGSNSLANGINQLANGGGQLLEASKQMQNGSVQLADGLVQTNNGLLNMDQKLPDLVAGTAQINGGLQQLQNQLPKQLSVTIGSQLQNNSAQMNAGLDDLQSQLSIQLSAALAEQMAAQQATQAAQIIDTLKNSNVSPEVITAIQQQLTASSPSQENLQQQLQPSIQSGLQTGFTQYKTSVNDQFTGSTSQLEQQIKAEVDPTFNQLTAGLSSIQDNQTKLQTGTHQLAEGSEKLTVGALALSSGQNQYMDSFAFFNQKLMAASTGADQLASGAGALSSGMNSLADGTAKISAGTEQLADGANALTDGTGKVSDGAKELKDKLGDAADQASAVHADQDTYDMMGEPILIDKEGMNQVPNYGTGFAPYFLSLGLFVGALLLTIVFPLREPASRPKSGFSWFIGKFGVFAIVGLIQALLADVILLFGLGIEVKSIPFFIITSVIISLTFMALIQFLVTLFGDPGRFIGIILLILQLTTSAGTFPLETIPKVLQPINALLPMTYTVQALKAAISSGDFAYMWHNDAILMANTIGFAILILGYFILKHKSNHVTITEQRGNRLADTSAE